MKFEVPVFMTRVECPVCKTVNEYETIKVGAYIERGRDTDFRPTGREWRNPKYRHINPLLYFMATCSSCFYTREFNKSFKEWKSDSAFRSFRQKAIRERHLNMLANAEGLIKMLGVALDVENAPQETAVTKLLLGILDEKMLEYASHLDLGRWYLRIAWLLREMSGGIETKLSTEQIQKTRLQLMLTSLRKTFDRCEQQINDIEGLVKTQPQIGPPAEDPYRSALNSWHLNLDPILKSVDDLLSWPNEDVSPPAVLSNNGSVKRTFGGCPSFEVFLQDVAGRDNEIPRNEREALLLSKQYYRQAYEGSRDISGSNQKIQVAYMIGELARRVGEIDQAVEYFKVAVRTGHELIHRFRDDVTKTALARKILEMAIDQTQACKDAGQSVS